MRRKLLLSLLLIFSITGISIASAATMNLDGGSLQFFEFTAEVPVESQPNTIMLLGWDGSQLEIITQGFACEDGAKVFMDVRNTGAAMQGTSTWTLLLDQSTAAQGEIPALGELEQIRLFAPVIRAGVYVFKAIQREGFAGKTEVISPDIQVPFELCIMPVETPTATQVPSPTLEGNLTPTITPESTPTVATLTPVEPTEMPTNSPTVEATPTEVQTEAPPTAEPSIGPTAEETDALSPTEQPNEPNSPGDA